MKWMSEDTMKMQENVWERYASRHSKIHCNYIFECNYVRFHDDLCIFRGMRYIYAMIERNKCVLHGQGDRESNVFDAFMSLEKDLKGMKY